MRALVILPTRELVIQVVKEFKSLKHSEMELSIQAVYGGTDMREQIGSLSSGVDVVVATPGRLADLYTRGILNFKDLKVLVLDEADQMLSLGFVEDIEKILENILAEKQAQKP